MLLHPELWAGSDVSPRDSTALEGHHVEDGCAQRWIRSRAGIQGDIMAATHQLPRQGVGVCFQAAGERLEDRMLMSANTPTNGVGLSNASASDATHTTINAADATKNAVDAVAKLSTARMMEGRERCVTAPNGAPDCVAAAEALCRKHGFATGKSMDFTSAEECPAKVYLGGATTGAECQTVTFISRAMCQ